MPENDFKSLNVSLVDKYSKVALNRYMLV